MAHTTTEFEKAVLDPSTESIAYQHMTAVWSMISALLLGTEEMRAQGSKYLPSHGGEKDDHYKTRLNSAVLFNVFELTLNTLAGKPFSSPLKLKDAPDEIEKLTTDIDLQGSTIHTFCHEWFKEGMAKGFAHVLIDYPSIKEEEKEVRTKLDDLQDERRPYWIMIRPENIIFANATTVNGRDVLTHVRIRENVIQRVGYAEIMRERIRILTPGFWELWQKKEKEKATDEDQWELIDTGITDLDFIPLVTFYADRMSLMFGKPPLEDLAYLNVAHWQSLSDQRNAIKVASFPMLAASGSVITDTDEIKVGPNRLLATSNPDGKFYYVENEGNAIAAGQNHLDELVDKMASYGSEFLKKRISRSEGKSNRKSDQEETTSNLKEITFVFIDAVIQALQYTAKWLSLENTDNVGKVQLETDFSIDEIIDADLKTLNEMRRNRDLSRESYLEEMKKRGILDEDFKSTEDLKKLQSEPYIATPFATGANTIVDSSGEVTGQGDGSDAGGKSNIGKPSQG